MKLNFGSGENKIEGFINCDTNKQTKPDIVCNLKNILPFGSKSCSEIWMIHCIEHVEKSFHLHIFKEFNRVLENNGELVLAYPEFIECAKRYIDNSQGKRDWWERTIFGRQAWTGDYHVSAMNTEELVNLLHGCGFGQIRHKSESYEEPYNTFLVARKARDFIGREEIFAREIFSL